MDADAAEDHGGAQFRVLAVAANAFVHLRAQFARRYEHQHADPALRRAEQLQDRQREAGRLAGAGLRDAEKIAPRKYDGDGLRLDRGGNGVALLGDSAEQLGL
jgi:hypothetical protein